MLQHNAVRSGVALVVALSVLAWLALRSDLGVRAWTPFFVVLALAVLIFVVWKAITETFRGPR